MGGEIHRELRICIPLLQWAAEKENVVCIIDASDAMFAEAPLTDADKKMPGLPPGSRYLDKALVTVSQLIRKRCARRKGRGTAH